jgi:hypothetical protein
MIHEVLDDITAAAADAEEQAVQLYRSESVLEALLQLLLQLGRQDSAAAALQQLPALPGFLIDVLAVSGCHQQQCVLEALMPVLVVFKERVLPVLQPGTGSHLLQHMQQKVAQQNHDDGSVEQRQQQRRQEEEQQATGLALLACVAGALQDCGAGAHDLEAMNAGWHLLALATHNMQLPPLHLHLQQQQQQIAAAAEWAARAATLAAAAAAARACTDPLSFQLQVVGAFVHAAFTQHGA